jgi:hypothetical protein
MRFAGYRYSILALYSLLVVLGLVWILRPLLPFRRSRESFRGAFILCLAIVPIAVVFLGSVFVAPMLAPRYLLPSFAAWIVVAGAGIASLRERWFPAALLVALALSGARLADWYTKDRKQDWRTASAYVLSNARQGDAVIFYGYGNRIPFEYYVSRFKSVGKPPELFELSSGPYPPAGYGRVPEPNEDLLLRLPVSHPRVWLVLGYDPESPLGREASSRRIQKLLHQNYPEVSEKAFLEIRIRLYGRERS